MYDLRELEEECRDLVSTFLAQNPVDLNVCAVRVVRKIGPQGVFDCKIAGVLT